jgi:hypothetical protein
MSAASSAGESVVAFDEAALVFADLDNADAKRRGREKARGGTAFAPVRPDLAGEVESHRACAVSGTDVIVPAAIAGAEVRFVADAKRRGPALAFALLAGEPEAVQLAEDGAPREAAAKARCEFGAGEALGVKRLQSFDGLFAPDKSQFSPPLASCRSAEADD